METSLRITVAFFGAASLALLATPSSEVNATPLVRNVHHHQNLAPHVRAKRLPDLAGPLVCTPPAPHSCTVETKPHIDLDFWGFNRPGADPQMIRPYLIAFVKALAGSKYLATVSQYCKAQGARACPGANPVEHDEIDRANPVPNPVTAADIRREAKFASGLFHPFGSVNENVIVVLPQGHPLIDPVAFPEGACAYHSFVVDNRPNRTVVFTGLPYEPDEQLDPALPPLVPPPGACGTEGVNFPNGIKDGETISASHEIGEALTDPAYAVVGGKVQWLGWNNGLKPGSNEIADICNNIDANVQLADGKTYPIEELWSNDAGKCVAQTGVSLSRPAALDRNWLLWSAHGVRHSLLNKALIQVSAGTGGGWRTHRPSSSPTNGLEDFVYGCAFYGGECAAYTIGGLPFAELSGFNGPQEPGIDASGRVYIANTDASTIPIYDPGFAKLDNTLGDPQEYPDSVAVFNSATKNLVAVSNILGYTTYANLVVYTSTNNPSSSTYMLNDPQALQGQGVTFDALGNCYWSFNTLNGTGQIDEFSGCSPGAQPTPLGIVPEFAGGIAFDAQNNFYYADQAAGTLNECPPPLNPSTCYVLASGFPDPVEIASNSSSLTYVMDATSGLFQVDANGNKYSLVPISASSGPVGVATMPVPPKP